jgi:hypothetical protein
MSFSPTRRSITVAALLACTLALAGTPVHAQLGGLRRAVERRVEQKAEDRVQAANLIEPTFDATTVEITAERLDRYSAAMERRNALRAQRQQEYRALDDRVRATRDSASAMRDAPEVRTYIDAESRYTDCRNTVREALSAEQERKTAALAAQLQSNPLAAQNDPKMKAMMAAMQEISATTQRGDTAGTRRAQERLYATIGITPTDSASLDRASVGKCGARPARPAIMIRSERLRQRSDSLALGLTALRGGGRGVKGEEVGMTDVQSRMFWERVASWLSGMRDAAPVTKTFTRAEYDLLVARRGALQKAFNGAE